MNNDESVLTNQTQFSYEEPYRETPTAHQSDDEVVKKPTSKLGKLLMIVGGIFAVLLMALVLLGRRPAVTQQSPFQQPVIVTPAPQETNPLADRVERLEKELQDADPVKQTLLFPPVELNIRLDPPTR